MKTLLSIVALSSALIVARAHAAYGDVDPSFSAPPLTGCTAIASREDGGAYVDQAPNSSPHDVQVVGRLDPHGAFVRDWGNSGVAAYTAVGSVMRQILRGKDGDVFAVDSTGITHIDASGHVDASFGNAGRVALSPVLSAALQGDGKIAVLMVVDGRYAFERLNAQGFADTSFGRSGGPLMVGPPADLFTVVYGWALRSDGGAELGTYPFPFPPLATQPRLTVVDETLNEIDSGGRLVPQGIATWMEPQAKADPTGGLVVGSYRRIVRFDASGVADPSFGNGGGADIPGTTGQYIDAVWREPDGKWTVLSHGIHNSGFFIIYNDEYSRANRFTEHGQLDPTFMAARIGGFSVAVHAADGSILAGCGLKRFITDSPRIEGAIVEYYHADLDHYFMTSSLNEIAGVDANPLGWLRTGETFGDWTPANLPGAAHVCRFYGDPVIGPNSHFYTGEDFECQGLIALQAATPPGVPVWHLEAKPFDIAIPASGTCPANLQPVYRVFNGPASNGHGPNHRYTTNPKVYAAMQAKGWLPEGVHFCAPPRDN